MPLSIARVWRSTPRAPQGEFVESDATPLDDLASFDWQANAGHASSLALARMLDGAAQWLKRPGARTAPGDGADPDPSCA